MSSKLSSTLAPYFPPEIWDPIIDAITAVVGPVVQIIAAPLSALASSVTGLF